MRQHIDYDSLGRPLREYPVNDDGSPVHPTLVRLPADPFRADVQRGQRQWWQGRIVDPDDKLDEDETWLDRADAAMDEADFE